MTDGHELASWVYDKKVFPLFWGRDVSSYQEIILNIVKRFTKATWHLRHLQRKLEPSSKLFLIIPTGTMPLVCLPYQHPLLMSCWLEWWIAYKQRVMTTTTPATGSDWTNTWVRRSSNDRRASVGSEGSSGSPVRRRSSFQEWLYPSAR